MKFDEQMEFLEEYGIATWDEIQLVMCIAGRSQEILNRILYARTGYRSIEQYLECEEEDWEV